jgi:hypothetical protein
LWKYNGELFKNDPITLATDKRGIDGQIYNVADDEPITAAEIMRLYGEPVAEDAASRALDPALQDATAADAL